MSDDNGHPPFEKPCAGSAQGCQRTAGSYFQHKIEADTAIPRYVNTTLLALVTDVYGKTPADDGYIKTYGSPVTGTKPYETFIDTSADGSCVSQGHPIQDAWTIPFALQTFTQPQMVTAVSISNPGTNYHVGDILTVAGGTVTPGGDAAKIVVTKVGGDGATGPILAASVAINTSDAPIRGTYLAGNPASPNTPTGGAGSGAQFTLTFANETIDFSACKKPGAWKGVQVDLAWNGQFGYKSHEYGASPAVDAADTLLWCGVTETPPYIPYESAQSAPDATKYLVKTISSKYNYVDTDPTNDYGTDVEMSVTVDQKTGVANVSGGGTGTFRPDGIETTDATSYIYISDFSRNDIIARLLSLISLEVADGSHIATTWSGDDTSGTFTNYFYDNGLPSSTLEYDMVSGSYTYSTYFEYVNDSDESVTTPFSIEQMTVSNAELDFTLTNYAVSCTGGATGAYWEVALTSVLSGANTSPDNNYDRDTLAATWPLNDDVIYPWRTDSKQQTVPLVSRDQPQYPVIPTASGYVTTDYTNPVTPDYGGTAYPDPSWYPAYGYIVAQNPLAGSTTISFAGQNTGTIGAPLTVDRFVTGGVINPVSWSITFPPKPGGGFYSLPSGWSFDTSTGHLYGSQTDGDETFYGFNITVTGIAATNGLIKGMPMPSAFTDADSFYYIEGWTPFPRSAFQDFFQWDFIDWQMCCITVGSPAHPHDWYSYGIGMWLSDYNAATGAQIPLNATQWTNKFDSINKPPGAWQMYNDPTIIGLGPCGSFGFGTGANNFQSMKYAEIMDEWEGENWARPAGDDKFLWIENDATATDAVYSAVNIAGSGDGSTWTITNYSGGTPPDAAITTGIWGGSVFGGFYNITSYASGTLTLGAKVFDVPTGWKASQGQTGDDAVAFGQLRFPTCPAILGRESVQWCSNETPIMIITENPLPELGMGSSDSVDISGIQSITAANGTWTITRIDDKTFTLNGSAGNLPPLYVAPPTPAGLMIVGNIDINNRPLVPNGSDISTVLSMTIEDGGYFVLIPGVNASTRSIMTVAEATAYYFSTGQHLGKFDTNDHCEVYANQLHLQQDATYGQDAWMNTHGAAAWYFNSTEPKGYYGLFSWLMDYRTNLERTRLNGTVDCSGTQVSQPAANNGYDTTGSGFSQSNPCMALQPCNPRVVCFTFNPDVDVFPGGNVITMPDIALDGRYGGKQQHQLMVTATELLWQRPHHPVAPEPNGSVLADKSSPPIAPATTVWKVDDGTCPEDFFTDTSGTTFSATGFWTRFYPMPPQVEVRLALPSDFGMASNESAPALPAGITIGFLSPVDYTTGDVHYPPDPLGFVTNGNPGSALTAFQIHSELCADYSNACRFNIYYADDARRC